MADARAWHGEATRVLARVDLLLDQAAHELAEADPRTAATIAEQLAWLREGRERLRRLMLLAQRTAGP
jgi:hypothetical protein